MSSERKLSVPAGNHLGTFHFNKRLNQSRDMAVLPAERELKPAEIKPAEGILSKMSALLPWRRSQRQDPLVTAFEEEIGLMDLNQFSTSADVVLSDPGTRLESKNIIARGVGPENLEVATKALRLIHEVNAESVRRGEPKSQIRVAAVPETLHTHHGATLEEVKLEDEFEKLNKEGGFRSNDFRAEAYQIFSDEDQKSREYQSSKEFYPFLGSTEKNVLENGETHKESDNQLVPLSRQVTVATIEPSTDLVVVAGIQKEEEVGNITDITDRIGTSENQLNAQTEQSEEPKYIPSNISYMPGYDNPQEQKDAA